MSVFNELLPKICQISNEVSKNLNEELKAAIQRLDKFEQDLLNEKRSQDKILNKNNVSTLRTITENEDKSTKTKTERDNRIEEQISNISEKGGAKKRSKNEVDDMVSPEQEKRLKRNASVKAQGIISKQVNVNLTQKLRRDKSQDNITQTKERGVIEENKENAVPLLVKIKQEKLSIPMETEPVSNIKIKEEVVNKDEFIMPPPMAPVAKTRKAGKEKTENTIEESGGRRRTTRTRKQTDITSVPTRQSSRCTRASSRETRTEREVSEEPVASTRRRTARAKKEVSDLSSKEHEESATDDCVVEAPTPGSRPRRTRTKRETSDLSSKEVCHEESATDDCEVEAPTPGGRPRRTRTKRVVPDSLAADTEKDASIPESKTASPSDKPRPKRTRKGPRATEKQPNENETKSLIEKESKEVIEEDSKIIIEKESKEAVEKEIKEVTEKESKKGIEKEIKENTAKESKEAIEKETKEVTEKEPSTIPKQNDPSQSPILLLPERQLKKITAKTNIINEVELKGIKDNLENTLNATEVISQKLNSTVTLSHLDKTIVLPNGLCNHEHLSPKTINRPVMNETVVLETNRETDVLETNRETFVLETNCETVVLENNRETIVLEKPPQMHIMDGTVVLEQKASNITEDNSLMTEDNDSIQDSPLSKEVSKTQPLSAVKAKVQQFEEMATRVTRKKTRAMTKKDDEDGNETPPDKLSRAVLPPETLTKLNSLIFHNKQPQVAGSASKPRDNGTQLKSYIPTSTSKLSVTKTKESVEDHQKKEKEDARRKKEAILEAKREMQKRKREEKMAAAAAARSAAERERRAQQEAAARERQEKQAHADQGRQERLKEAERKKLELARKVAETEERRRAEEYARRQRLAEEQKRAEMTRKKQLEEAEAVKKEALLMEKEIERRKREFNEKQKMKQRMEGDKLLTPLKTPGTPGAYVMPPIEPVYMADGFEYLNSDEEEEAPARPIPAWSHPKVRRRQLEVQAQISSTHVDRLFSVRAHTPDLREIFPGIERTRLKRTSSAVWRTPPSRLAALPE